MRSGQPNSSTVRAIAVGAILALFLAIWIYRSGTEKSSVPNETAAGLKLLSREFAGPGYFHLDPSVTNQPPSESHPDYCITANAAREQIGRVLAERNWTTNRAADLERIVDRLAEAPESRAVGGAKVNVLRLNLALDELQP
jgi:K+-transporting ATPase c subunit